MRSVGLAAILLGVLFFLFPYYREWVPFIVLGSEESRLVAGLLLAAGAVSLAVYSRQQ